MHTPPELVIFDCDGVIVDSEPVTNRALQLNLSRHGLDMSLDEVLNSFVGGTIQGVMDKALRMGACLPEDWVETFYQEMFVALEENCSPVPNVSNVLDRLDAAKIPYAIGSNGPHAKWISP